MTSCRRTPVGAIFDGLFQYYFSNTFPRILPTRSVGYPLALRPLLGRAVGCDSAAQLQDPELDDSRLIKTLDPISSPIHLHTLRHGRRPACDRPEQPASKTIKSGPVWITGHRRTNVHVQHSIWRKTRSGIGSSRIDINAGHTRAAPSAAATPKL